MSQIGVSRLQTATAMPAPHFRSGTGQTQLDRQAAVGVYDIDDRSGFDEVAVGSRFYIGKTQRFAIRVDVARMRADLYGGTFKYTGYSVGVTHR